jgi:hypothetical protein
VSRRSSLPGAAELFRLTGDPAADRPVRVVPDLGEPGGDDRADGTTGARPARQTARPRTGQRRPTGREKHDEKITVYVSAQELLDLEAARLTLRGEHGIAADRGRVVREALAVVLADLDAHGEDSILVRRLRGL